MNIVILGQQGSGKGTQAELLAQKFNLEHLDMGALLRGVAEEDTPLGREVYAIQNVTNTLVPERIVKEILMKKLVSIPGGKGIVFDGIPRTMEQVQYMEEMLLDQGKKIDQVFFIYIPEEDSAERISKRRVCNRCKAVFIMEKDIKGEEEKCLKCGGEISHREDDTEAGINKRLEIFKEETMPALDHYRKKKALIEIDGRKSIDEVFGEIIKNISVN